MLTPDYLQGAPAELEELFLRLEEDIIADICRRIAKAGYLTDSAEHQVLRLRELGAGTEHIKQKISEYSALSDEAVDRLFFDAAQTSDEFYKKAYAQANIGYTPYEYNDFFQQAVTASVNQTKGELRNFTQSMGFSYRGSNGQVRFHGAAEAYRDCLDYAYMQVMTGAVDHNTAIKNATRRLTEGGLQFVDYASGVRCHADVAARRAVLTGLSQMTGKISEHNAAELGTDIVEVDAHAGARPDHAEWQGKWYSLSGKSKKYPSLKAVTGYGTVTGLKGANCRHDFYPVIEGISEPSYTEEELKNIDPPPFEYNGKTYTYYEAPQKQRAMERSMRKTKREILAADATNDKDSFAEKSVLLRRQKEEYGRFSKAAGLSVRNERAQVGGFGHSQASRAAWAERKAKSGLDNAAKSGIINYNKFNTTADPMREIMGSAEESHPKEIKALSEHIISLGAKLVRPEHEDLNYQPGLSRGEPGIVSISKNASYSAWLHEVKHLDDDYADGFLGFRIFQDPEKCAKREIEAYQIEIDMAKSFGREDMVKRLEALRDDEIKKYR